MTLLEKIKSKTWYKSITTQQEILLELASNLGTGGIGSKGDKGDQGLQGVAGAKGDQGIQGVAGTKGDQGIQGIQGISGTSGSNASSIAFNISPTFKSFPLVVAQKLITAPLTITPNTTGAIAGASVLMRFVADGNIANTPIFSGAEQVSGSSGWDNRAGIVNLVQFTFDGVDFFYSIVQKALGAVLDLQAPVLVSSEINITPFGTKAILTFNENLLSTSLPTQFDFSIANLSSTTINGKILTLFFTKAFETGITLVLQYSGNSIKDLAGNLANSFTTSIVIPNVNAIIPANLDSRQSGIDQVSVGTYKKNLGGWRVAMSSSLNFVGDKTFETSDASLAGTGAIIGLDTRVVADTTIAYSNVKYWIGYYGGSYKAATNGSQTGALAGYIAGDVMRLKRTGTNLVAQLKRSGGTTWTDLFTWTAVTEPLSTLTILDDNLAQVSLVIS